MPVRVLFLVGVLHTPLLLVGLIEGLAAAVAILLKLALAPRAGQAPRRPALILAGYALSNGVKPLLALAGAWPQALGLIVLDRVGNGLRVGPRDAMLTGSVAPENRGKALGFHRTLDTVGTVLGPLLAFAILALTREDLRQVFAWALVPGLAGVIVLVALLRRPSPVAPAAPSLVAPRRDWWPQLTALGPRFWLFIAITAIFALGHSSVAFLLLRTQTQGTILTQGVAQPLLLVPILYLAYLTVYAVLAAPLGALADRWGRLPMLALGYGAFGLAYGWLALANQGWHIWAAFLVYGVYAAATDGVGRGLLTELVTREQRGVALTVFAAVLGVAALPANLLAGWLWSTYGASAAFGAGGWLAFVACALLLAWGPWLLGARPLAPAPPAPVPARVARET
jgi:MFS family permease